LQKREDTYLNFGERKKERRRIKKKNTYATHYSLFSKQPNNHATKYKNSKKEKAPICCSYSPCWNTGLAAAFLLSPPPCPLQQVIRKLPSLLLWVGSSFSEFPDKQKNIDPKTIIIIVGLS